MTSFSKIFFVALWLAALPTFAFDAGSKAANDAAIRSLADRTASQLAQKNVDAVYASMSPKLKSAYSRNDLTTPVLAMQKTYGNIKSFDYEVTTYGKRGVGKEWIRTLTYWYHAKTDKHADKTYLKVEVTQEQGQYFIAGYSMERALLDGKHPFLKH